MKISEIILVWYKKNKRDLPWRKTNDPYTLWVSEIIMQQTRVDQGMAYYLRFMEMYPDLISLAEAKEQDVMKLWQGLGYYSRARNMLKAAQQVQEDFGGVFPTDYNSLLRLTGIGPYTAAAVASFSSNQPHAVVDGNVARVYSRLFEISEEVNTPSGMRVITELANAHLNIKDPAEHNQAMMEFGALQCTPGKPDCSQCPLSSFCAAFQSGRVADFPKKIKKAPQKIRYFVFLLIQHQGYTYISKRRENDIWKQMFEFPLIESSMPVEPEDLNDLIRSFTALENKDFSIDGISNIRKHILSHRTIYARFVHIKIWKEDYPGLRNWLKIRPEAVSDYPLPRLIDRYLEESDKGAP